MNIANYTYRFDLDRDYFVNLSMRFQSILPFFTLLTIRPLIFLILMKKRDYMAADIRWGYIMNQFAMMAQEFNFCFLFRIHDLSPYAALYCDGPICRAGIDKQLLMAILSLTTIGTVPTFLFLLIRMHQLIIATTPSRLKLKTSAQTAIVIFMTFVLLSNVAGFYAFSTDCSDSEEMEKIPDLAWLKERGGTLFLFGHPGRAHYLYRELLVLFGSITIIAPFVAVATVHSMYTLYMQHSRQVLTTRTQRYQLRFVQVFFIQLVGVNLFYILPLSMFLLHMAIDLSFFPAWLIAVGRCLLVITFTLESTQLSLIFLLKNPVHRQIIMEALHGRSNGAQNEASINDRKLDNKKPN